MGGCWTVYVAVFKGFQRRSLYEQRRQWWRIGAFFSLVLLIAGGVFIRVLASVRIGGAGGRGGAVLTSCVDVVV